MSSSYGNGAAGWEATCGDGTRIVNLGGIEVRVNLSLDLVQGVDFFDRGNAGGIGHGQLQRQQQGGETQQTHGGADAGARSVSAARFEAG